MYHFISERRLRQSFPLTTQDFISQHSPLRCYHHSWAFTLKEATCSVSAERLPQGGSLPAILNHPLSAVLHTGTRWTTNPQLQPLQQRDDTRSSTLSVSLAIPWRIQYDISELHRIYRHYATSLSPRTFYRAGEIPWTLAERDLERFHDATSKSHSYIFSVCCG